MISQTMATIFKVIERHPLMFNCITGGTLCAASDAFAQQIEMTTSTNNTQQHNSNKNNNKTRHHADNDYNDNHIISLDHCRIVSAGVIGAFFGGFVYPMAYAKLDTIWQGIKFTTVLKKSLAEIATVGIFVNATSMTCRGLLKPTSSPNVVFDHVLDEIPTVTMNDIRVWLPYNLLAFTIIPPMIRPTTTAIMEASWQTYISLRSHDYQNNNHNHHHHHKGQLIMEERQFKTAQNDNDNNIVTKQIG